MVRFRYDIEKQSDTVLSNGRVQCAGASVQDNGQHGIPSDRPVGLDGGKEKRKYSLILRFLNQDHIHKTPIPDPFVSSFSSLETFCQKKDFAGWDPYDGLNSRLFQALLLSGTPVGAGWPGYNSLRKVP